MVGNPGCKDSTVKQEILLRIDIYLDFQLVTWQFGQNLILFHTKTLYAMVHFCRSKRLQVL